MRQLVCGLVLSFVTLLYAHAGGDEDDFLRVALVQLDASEVGDFDAIEAFVREAKHQGADLVVFPESSLFGWLNPLVFTQADSIPGRQSSRFAAIAAKARIWLAVGLAERGPSVGKDKDVHHAYDSGILINPSGEIVLHQRKHNVLRNAFNNDSCRSLFGVEECSYSPGELSEIKITETPFGRMAILVCADAYTYEPSALQALKVQKPDVVIVPWGVTAGKKGECGREGFNATQFAAEAAEYLETAYVIGANPVGERTYGRFLPSWYCGESGYAKPGGSVGGDGDMTHGVVVFDIPVRAP